MADLVEDPQTATRDQLEKAQQIALAEPQLLNRLISSAADATGINVTFSMLGIDKTGEIPAVVAAVRDLIKDYEARYSNIKIYTTGRIINNKAFREASLYDITHIVPLAFAIAMALIALYLYIASRSLRTTVFGTTATLIVVISSLAATMGVVIAWVFAITLLPAITVLLPIRVNIQENPQNTSTRLADFVIRRRHSLFVVMLVAIAVTTSFLPTNRLNDVWAEYFDEIMEVRKNFDLIRERLTSPNSIEFSLGTGEENGIADPEYLQHLEAFSQWLAAQPEILHVNTFTDVMKRLNKSMHGDDPQMYRLPTDRELAAQYLLLYELSLPFGLDLTNQLTMNKDAARVIGTIRDSSTATVLALQDRASAWLRDNAPPKMHHEGTSTDVMFAHIGYSNVRSMLQGTVVALLIISLVLGIALRSVKFGLISLIPNIIPASAAFGLWGIIDGEIGLGLSVVAGMTLGIVVDYTVHFLSKYLRAQREYGFDEPAAIRYAFSTVGTALVITTLILVANFSVLAFSDFALNGDMGMLTAITIVIALLVDFFSSTIASVSGKEAHCCANG